LGVEGSRCDKCNSAEYKREKGDLGHFTCYYILEVSPPGSSPNPLYLTSGLTTVNFVLDVDKAIATDLELNVTIRLNNTKFNVTFRITSSSPNAVLDQGSHLLHSQQTGTWKLLLKRKKLRWSNQQVHVHVSVQFLDHFQFQIVDVSVRKHIEQIDLKQFFIIFFTCVVILLLVFLVVWTAKMRYSQYRNQVDQELQLIERAARPFKTHTIIFKPDRQIIHGSIYEIRPVAIEPLKEDKYGIVSYLVSFPGPPGSRTLAIGSGSFVTALPFDKITNNSAVVFHNSACVET